ncbi:hypothetical protein [Paraburkholderia bannensis]|uniref:hypothetical protein n=1 Tax=Paraburkholderia bannensis TaxID=765414 RepID=UPI002AB78687|nr:hypothetical protein [Paraburkholderia bannensis]
MLAEAAATQLPWFAGALSRPAFARLLRTSAALACAYSLRHVITAPARAQFARAIGLPVLAALQCHPRAQREPLRFDPPVDCFNRHSITAAGLAIALRATSGAAQRQWLQLRLPCQCAQDAAQWSLQDTAARTALDLIGDAFLLLDARRTPC